MHTNVATRGSSRVYGNDHAALVSESERRCTVLDFDSAIWIGMVIRVQSKETSRLLDYQQPMVIERIV